MIVQIIHVFDFPPREFYKILVNLDSLYEINYDFSSPNFLIIFYNANNDLFIFSPSLEFIKFTFFFTLYI